MDHIFLFVTITFFFFLFISYFLNILKLSTPLLLIYLIFCFSYIIDDDVNDGLIVNNNYLKNTEKGINNSQQKKDKPINLKSTEKNNVQEKDVSKPIVSFNPKPIIIDSNLIIQKDKDKSFEKTIDYSKKNEKIKKDDSINRMESLKLNEIMICRGVYKRNPIKPGFIFANNVDSLFCYTKISNSGPKQEIKHLWYYQDNLITSVTYNIKTSYNYRSWSKKTILPNQIGKWRVDIIDNNDKILGSREFDINSMNNAF